MKLYTIEISNYLDDTSYNVLVLSNEHLTIDNSHINSIAGITKTLAYNYVSNVSIAKVISHCWTEEEYNEHHDIINKIN